MCIESVFELIFRLRTKFNKESTNTLSKKPELWPINKKKTMALPMQA